MFLRAGLRSASWAALFTLLVGCGGGGAAAPQPPPEWTWDGPPSPISYPAPESVEYIAEDGERHTAIAIPGQVVAWFSASTSQASALSTVQSLSGAVLDLIPSIRCCLIGVGAGTEDGFIDGLRATGQTDHVAPHLALQEQTGVVATENCGSAHATRVAELLQGCSPLLDPETPVCSIAIPTKGGFDVGHAAINAVSNYDDLNVVNVSAGPPVPPGRHPASRYETWTDAEQGAYIWSMREWLVAFASLALESERLGQDSVFVLAAGNQGAPLDDALALARLTTDTSVSSALGRRVVMVGAEQRTAQFSNRTDVPDADFVVLDNADDAQHADKGTSYSAPRVSAMLRRAMRDQGIGASEALRQLKAQATGGVVLNDPCGPGVPDLTGPRFYRPNVTDGHYIRFERRDAANPQVLTILQGSNTIAESVSAPGTIVVVAEDLRPAPMAVFSGSYNDDWYLTRYWMDGAVYPFPGTTVTASADGRVVTYNWGLWEFRR